MSTRANRYCKLQNIVTWILFHIFLLDEEIKKNTVNVLVHWLRSWVTQNFWFNSWKDFKTWYLIGCSTAANQSEAILENPCLPTSISHSKSRPPQGQNMHMTEMKVQMVWLAHLPLDFNNISSISHDCHDNFQPVMRRLVLRGWAYGRSWS